MITRHSGFLVFSSLFCSRLFEVVMRANAVDQGEINLRGSVGERKLVDDKVVSVSTSGR